MDFVSKKNNKLGNVEKEFEVTHQDDLLSDEEPTNSGTGGSFLLK